MELDARTMHTNKSGLFCYDYLFSLPYGRTFFLGVCFLAYCGLKMYLDR